MEEQTKNPNVSNDPELNDINAEIAAAQLRKLRLELKNLEEERGWWSHVPRLIVPMITALVSIFGFLFGVWVFTNQQEKDRVTRENERISLLRNQYRTGYDQLLQFSANPNMTATQALALQKQLNTLIDSIYDPNSTDDKTKKEGITTANREEKDNVTNGILSLVYNDCDFTQTRNVRFDKGALQDWNGYKEKLKGNIVMEKYFEALKDLQVREPDYIASIRGAQDRADEDPEPLKDPYRSVIDGFICHYNLLSDDEKATARIKFKNITKNPFLAADLSKYPCR
ncbi:MAG TPA: hypothetical protein VHQ64_16035 [Pyrinomonadaceae bacterium]|jgi:hypothetical protein|nr:hypothetical protein [Pyrinomonadaceae bacterium]